MNILQINSVCGIGSTGRIATDIHAILEENGHKSTIAYGRDLPKNCSETIKIGNKLDNYAHVAKTRIFDDHGFGSKSATKQFIQEMRALNPDVIHLHNIHGYYLNVELLFQYLKEVKKPVVWTLHDCWSFTGHCAYFDFAGCEKWKTGCYACPEKKEYPKTMVLDQSKRNYLKKRLLFQGVENLTIVTPSEWLGDVVRTSFLGTYDIQVINNGVDTSVFKPTESNIREKLQLTNAFMILGVASVWDRRKGLKYFLELSSKLKKDEKIVLVGVSDEQIKGLPENIIGISRTNNVNELAELYSLADVFVNPTLEDNYPTTNLESQACGTPVITFRTGGSPESIQEFSGIITKSKTVEEIRKSIDGIKNDERYKNADAILEHVRANFSKKEKFAEYIELYHKVL